jgi:hypothetical protein
MIFKITGERNSGGTFLHKLIEKNLKNTLNQKKIGKICYFWKHSIPSKKIFFKDETLIDIFIVRDLYSWLVSMYNNPYHLQKFDDFKKFLTQKQVSNETNLYCVTDNNEVKQLNYEDNNKNIFEIRYYKYNKMVEYFRNNDNVILVSHSYLKNNDNCKIFLDKINEIYKLNITNKWEFIDYYAKKTNQKTNGKESKYNFFCSKNDIEDYKKIINGMKNHKIEYMINNLSFVIKKDNDTYCN